MIREDQSLFYDEFLVGDNFFSGQRTIFDKDILSFAELSGDRNPIHIDDEYSGKSMYGERIAHGLLVLSISSGLAFELGFAERSTAAFRALEWKFKGPIKIGDTIRAVFEVIEKREISSEEAGLVIFQVKVLNQDDKIVQMGKWSLIIKKK
jgi:3-hydroxybutyryl-CoA dehydratase